MNSGSDCGFVARAVVGSCRVVAPRTRALAPQNAYAVSLLQAETLAAAVLGDLAIVFAEAESASAPSDVP